MTLAIIEPSAKRWDHFVLQHPYGHLLQLSSWGQLKATSGWVVQRIAVIADGAETNNSPILAGAQLLFRQQYVVSVAYVPRGPLFSGDTTIDTLLLKTLKRVARNHRAIFLRLEPNILESQPESASYHSWLLLQHFCPATPIQPRSTIRVDLTTENLFASFSKGHRADIRRAERQGVTIQVGTMRNIDTFYGIMQTTGKRADFGIHAKAYYCCAWQLFQERCSLLLANQNGHVVAAHMVFADAQTGYYLYSGATEQGLKSGANHLLQWHALQWAQNQGCICYDLWGIPDMLGRAATLASNNEERAALEEQAQQDPLIGVYRFKKGFGGKVVRYLPAYDQIYLPPLYALWQRWLQ